MCRLRIERVRELFKYSKRGELVRRKKVNGLAKKGDIAGYINSNGYLRVSIDNKEYYIHQIIFMYHHCYLPENEIDHINGVKTDNRIENLREVTRSCNIFNTGNSVRNTSGVKGVTKQSRDGRWRASIYINGKAHFLGLHTDFLEAVMARYDAEQRVPGACNPCSPAAQYLIKEGYLDV